MRFKKIPAWWLGFFEMEFSTDKCHCEAICAEAISRLVAFSCRVEIATPLKSLSSSQRHRFDNFVR